MSHVSYRLERNTLPDYFMEEGDSEVLIHDIFAALFIIAKGADSCEAVEAVLSRDLFNYDRAAYLDRFTAISSGVAQLQDYAMVIGETLRKKTATLERVRVTRYTIDIDILVSGEPNVPSEEFMSDLASRYPVWNSQTPSQPAHHWPF